MSQRSVILFTRNNELAREFSRILERRQTSVRAIKNGRASLAPPDASPPTLIVIDTTGRWLAQLRRLKDRPFVAVLGPGPLLKKTIEPIERMTRDLNGDAHEASSRKEGLEDFIEKKLSDFLGKIKESEGKNVFGLLMREVERPLITLTLKQTGWNQIRAARLLGMNRNTLRKKIKELKISLPERA